MEEDKVMQKILKRISISLLLIISLVGAFSPTAYAKSVYYGNGVTCNTTTKKCTVNWGKTVNCIGNISVASWAGATIAKC